MAAVTSLIFAPLPRDPIAQPEQVRGEQLPTLPRLLLPRVWVDYFTALITRIEDQPTRIQVVSLEDQSASIGTTAIPLDALPEGYYRITYYARITQAATVNSSLTITLGWTESGISLSSSGAALVLNVVTAVQGGTVMVLNDQAAPLTYATTYASAGATVMKYRLDIVVEAINQ